MTRDEYLKHGLEPIFVESEDAFEERLSDTGLSDFTVKPGRDSESMKALRADRAAKLAPVVAPTLVAEDMPTLVREEYRDAALAALPFSRSDRAEISQKAIELELCNTFDYWESALGDCYDACLRAVPMAQGGSAAKLQDLQVTLLTGLEDHPDTLGSPRIGSYFAAVALDERIEIDASVRKAMMAHAVMHSRRYARDARQFEALSDHLPEAAAPWVDHVRDGKLCSDVMGRVRKHAERQDDLMFGYTQFEAQRDALVAANTEITKGAGLSGFNAIARSKSLKIRATERMMRESGVHEVDSPAGHQANRAVNLSILELGGSDDTAMKVFIVELARRKRSEQMVDLPNLSRNEKGNEGR